MNICAFVDALGISVRPAQIVSVLSAATNHFSADKKGHVLTDGKSPLNIKEQGKQRFPAFKVHELPHTLMISSLSTGFHPFI